MKAFSKNLSRIISLLITVVMLMAVTPVMAEDAVYVYESIDISAAANSKFYVDPTVTTDTQTTLSGFHNFLHGSQGWYDMATKGAEWPLAIREHSDGDGFPVARAVLTEDASGNPVITSERSGVSYALPGKDGTDDILMVEGYTAYNVGGAERPLTKTVNTPGNYGGVSVLVANGLNGTSVQALTITATYTDGDTVVKEIAQVPQATAAAASGADNFVAELSAYKRVWNQGKKIWVDSSFTAISDGTSDAIALYEYEIELDSAKTLQSLTFAMTKNGNSRTVGILAISGAVDWSDRIAEAEEAIAAAVDDSGNVDKVLAAVDSVNNIKKAGIDVDTHISNIAEYNALFEGAAFGDVLLGSVFGGTTVDWDNTETLLSQSESIVAAIEVTGNSYEDLAEETKAVLEAAYADMVDVLLESEAETAVLEERFTLLKDTKIDALSDIFREKVIWAESFSKAAEPDLVTFDLDFSQPIAEDKLNADYISVRFGDAAVNPALITYEAKITDGDITGVAVKIINSLDYSKEYTITVDEALTGANDGVWAYPCAYTETVTAPFAVDSSEISVTGNTVSGSLALTNSTGSAKPYVVLIAAYSDDNKMLASKPVQGRMAPGVSPANVDFTAPDGTAEIYCYVLGDYTNMSLLSASIKLK